MFSGWDAAVVAAMPVMKEINVVKFSSKPQLHGAVKQQQQQSGVGTEKDSREWTRAVCQPPVL